MKRWSSPGSVLFGRWSNAVQLCTAPIYARGKHAQAPRALAAQLAARRYRCQCTLNIGIGVDVGVGVGVGVGLRGLCLLSGLCVLSVGIGVDVGVGVSLRGLCLLSGL